MKIELHCPACGKTIRAPEDAGGKRGKCPYCTAEVYIPDPNEMEEIPLAPIDEAEERRAEQLRRESIEFATSVDKETAGKYDIGDAPGRTGKGALAGAGGKPGAGAADVDIPHEVERFVLAMHATKMDQADAIANRLRRAGDRARDYVQGLLLDQMPPKFGSVPEKLVQGFLKALLERLG